MALTNKQKANIRWELIDAVFTRLELLEEGTQWVLGSEETITAEQSAYYKKTCKRIAAALNVEDHMCL